MRAFRLAPNELIVSSLRKLRYRSALSGNGMPARCLNWRLILSARHVTSPPGKISQPGQPRPASTSLRVPPTIAHQLGPRRTTTTRWRPRNQNSRRCVSLQLIVTSKRCDLSVSLWTPSLLPRYSLCLVKLRNANAQQYLDKRLFVQLNGSRKVIGVLRGYDVRLLSMSYQFQQLTLGVTGLP